LVAGNTKLITLLSPSFFTISAVWSFFAGTRTRNSPSAGPPTMEALFASRNAAISAAFACGEKRISASTPWAAGTVAGADV